MQYRMMEIPSVPYTVLVEPLYKGQVGDILCPLYSGASLQGTSWRYPLSLIQRSLSTRDKLEISSVPYTVLVEPLYKGQVGDILCPLYSRASLQGTSWRYPLSLIQRSLSTRDKLEISSVPYTAEPLYKGQVGDILCPLYSGASLQGTSWRYPLSLIQRSLSTRDKLEISSVPYTAEPLYKGQVGTGPLSLIQRNRSTRDRLGTGPLSLVRFSEVAKIIGKRFQRLPL